jgi:hypothetical protein
MLPFWGRPSGAAEREKLDMDGEGISMLLPPYQQEALVQGGVRADGCGWESPK